MGARGPKKGFKLAKLEGAAKPLSSITAEKPAKPAKATPSVDVVAPAISAGDAEYASWMVAKVTAPVFEAARAAPARPVKVEPTAADLENPEKLTGNALRELAHKRGLSRSELEGMPDEKIRMQLLYITNRQYAEEGA